MLFKWDTRKNRRNIRQYGVAFEDAKELFEYPYVESVDERHDYTEERLIATGYVQGRPIIVIFTELPGDVYRIISARRMTSREEKKFLQDLGQV